MDAIILGDKSGRRYQSWLNNKEARDQKAKEKKNQWYKVETGDYPCQGGGRIYFLTWK